MSVFSTNQNRQFYVVSDVKTSEKVTDASDAGAVLVKCVDGELYFVVKGADTVLKSDRIPVRNLSYIKAIAAEDMVTPLKSVLVSLSPDINSGAPVVGQDYVLRINFRQFYGMSDQDQYFKDAAVHVTKGMDAAAFYTKLVDALNLSFSRELGATRNSNPYLEFEVKEDNSGVLITEKEQHWTLGTEAQEPVIFDIVPTTIYVDGVDEVWGIKTDETPAKADAVVGSTGIGNGKKIADLEWFCMGERGDQYRQIGWPNNIDTKYLVDPTKQYDVLEIHYAFTDEGISSYRSEKDITFVAPTGTVINSLVKAINQAAALSITGTDGAVPTSDDTEGKAVVDSNEASEAVTTEDTSEEKAVVDDAEAGVATTEETSEEKAVTD